MEQKRIITATLAEIYLQQGYMEKAIEIYEKIVKKEPQNDFCRQRLASLKKEMKEKQKTPAFKRLMNKKLW